MGDKLNDVILGGLLHDVGKFFYRSGGKFIGGQENQNKNHKEHGSAFLTQMLAKGHDENELLEIRNCIEYHHTKDLEKSSLPKDSIAYIIYEADNIAAGCDRREIEEAGAIEENSKATFNEENDKDTGRKSYFWKYCPLKSIFNNIKPDDKIIDQSYALRTLDERSPINYPTGNYIKADKGKYEIIEDNFQHLLNGYSFKKDNPNSILQMLEATMSYVPSDTFNGRIGDVSLYEHLKLTSAIASCMYLAQKEEFEKENKEIDFSINFQYPNPNRDKDYFLLVSGDLSGVQDFIYTIASKGALKSLRARSFYLDLMIEHIVDEILESLGLSRANLLYTGGGHFYMLLPNTEKNKETIDNVRRNINNWFFEHYGTALYLAIDFVTATSNDLMDSKDKETGQREGLTSKLFQEVTRKLSQQKTQRYNYDFEQLKNVLSPQGVGDNERECSVCSTSSHLEQDDESYICKNCKNLKLIGAKLPEKANESTFVVITEKEPEEDYYLRLPSLNNAKYLYFKKLNTQSMTSDTQSFRWKKIEGDINSLITSAQRIYTINCWVVGKKVTNNLWVGDYNKENPEDKYTMIDFEELAESSIGINRLAVMRADVDGLGDIFTKGFNKNLGTLSRYTTLSRQLTLFFKHAINQVCETSLEENNYKSDGKRIGFKLVEEDRENNKKNLVIIYAGGDDLFVVGAWNHVIEFAVDLREAFGKFTCDKLTFSAGIALFHHDFPIYQMANLTGKLEELAKDQPQKDSIALFGMDEKIKHVYQWENFENGVCEKLELFTKNAPLNNASSCLDNKYISTGLVYRLLQLVSKQLEDGKYSINLARMAYILARQQDSRKDDSVRKKYIEDIKTKIFGWLTDEDKAVREKHRQELCTALNLFLYLCRNDSSNKMIKEYENEYANIR